MRKNDKIALTLFSVFGIILVVIGLRIDMNYYSSLIFAMGVAMTFNSIMQFLRFWHNTRPQNIEAYKEKQRQQSINLKDERKIQLRNRSGYITWLINMISFFVASFVAGLFKVNSIVVISLFIIGILEYVIATIIYKFLCKRM